MTTAIYDIIIIGGGPAGYTAALYSARGNLSTLVIEQFLPGGQMGTTNQIDNYPGFAEGVSGADLALQMRQGAERFGAKTLLATVSKVELPGKIKTVETSKGVYQARTVILATGAKPRKLGLSNETELTGKGISYCATCDGMFFRGKTVAVVGGGNTAVSDVLYLSRLCEQIYLIHRRDQLRASRIYTSPLTELENVEIIYDTEVVSATANGVLQSIELKNRKTNERTHINVSGLFIAVGYEPNSALYQGQVNLDQTGYVTAGEDTKTSIPGVFVAGDLRNKALRQIVTAISDGANAAYFADDYLQTESR